VTDKRPPRTASVGDVTGESACSADLMSSLGGKLIALPRPDRPGSWAYRVLEDGTLLETQLTTAERRQLDDHVDAKRRARIAVLNQHPLNQAAKKRLEQDGHRPLGEDLHLLELAIGADPEEGMGDTGLLLAEWIRTVERQQMALETLENCVSPDEVAELAYDQVLDCILGGLQSLES
jgi:hypothetical protein